MPIAENYLFFGETFKIIHEKTVLSENSIDNGVKSMEQKSLGITCVILTF